MFSLFLFLTSWEFSLIPYIIEKNEREIIILNFYMKNLSIDQKSLNYQWSKASTMKNNQNVRIYLIQIYQSFTNYVTYTFSLQQYAFIFSNILRVHARLNINLLLKLNRKKRVLIQTQTNAKMKDEWIIWINPFF